MSAIATFTRLFSVTPGDTPLWYQLSEAVAFFCILAGVLIANAWFWIVGAKHPRGRENDALRASGEPSKDVGNTGVHISVEKPPKTGFGKLGPKPGAETEVGSPTGKSRGGPAEQASGPDGQAPQGGRLHYLDLIRVFCIVLVVLGHVLATFTIPWQMHYSFLDHSPPFPYYAASSLGAVLAFASLLQVLFFVSAYFSPTSLDHHGASGFLQRKLQRLGVPLVANAVLIDPLLLFFVKAVVYDGYFGPYEYKLQLGVAWFLQWLIIFNVAYVALAHLPGPEWKISLPSLPLLLLYAVVLGLLQGAIAFAQGGMPFDYGFLRLQWALAPSFVAFFAAGVIAARNNWLEQLRSWHISQKVAAACLTPVAAMAFVPLLLFINVWPKALVMGMWGICTALFAVLSSVTALLLFQSRLNNSNGFTNFMGRGAYGAYLLHPWVIVCMAWSYTAIITAAGVPLTKGVMVTADLNPKPDYIFAAWGLGYTFVTTVPITWGISCGLARLPGFNRVLL